MVKPCSRNKNSPLVRLQNKYERYGTKNNVLSGRGLARRPLSARRVHIKMTSHVAQCIHNTSYCAARELCRLQIWTKRYREHFTVLVIWTLVYREHVPRTFCQGFVPRTYMNGLCQLGGRKVHSSWVNQSLQDRISEEHKRESGNLFQCSTFHPRSSEPSAIIQNKHWRMKG